MPLYRQGNTLMATLCVMLCATTIGYHWRHDPRVRALDIITLWVTAVTAVAHAIAGLAIIGFNVWHAMGLGLAVGFNVINVAPWTKDENDSNLIKLPWHATLHAMCTMSMFFVALGWGSSSWV